MTHSIISFFPTFPPNSFLIILNFSTWSTERQEDASEFLSVSVHKRERLSWCYPFLISSTEFSQNTFCIFFWNERCSFGSKVDWRHYLRKKLTQSSTISLEGSWFILYFQQSMNHSHNPIHPLSFVSGTKPVLEAIIVRVSLHARVLWLSASQGQEVCLYQMFSKGYFHLLGPQHRGPDVAGTP